MKIHDLNITFKEAKDSKDILIIHSAMASPSKIYNKMSDFLVQNGISVVYFDPRGVGNNSDYKEATLQDWCDDVEMIADHFREKDYKTHFLGHSIGGQLFGRFKSPDKFNKVIFLCSSTGIWWENKHIPTLLQSAFVMNIYIPLSNFIFGYTGAELVGMGLNLPKYAASEWAKWCRSKGYIKSYSNKFSSNHYNTFNGKILNIRVSDDPIANKDSSKKLQDIYSKADFIEYVVEGEGKVGHFGFSHPSQIKHWEKLKDYIKE